MDAYDRAIELDPTNSKYITTISAVPKEERDKKLGKCYDDGKTLLTLHKYEESLQLFDKVIRIDPSYTPAYLGKGNTLLELGRHREACQYFDKALQLQPSHALAYVGKGKALLKLKFYEEALHAFDKAIQLNAKLLQAHVGKGNVLFALQRSMDALKAYGTAIDLNTDDIDCYKNTGEILIDLGPEYNEQAIQMYAKALHLVPELVSAHLAQGNALFELKRYDESLAAYKQVVTLDKSNAFAYLGIGDILAARNSYEIATEYYEKALQLIRNEQNPDLLWSLVYPVRTSCRPAHIQFELLQHFVVNAPPHPHKDEALRCIGNLYNKLFSDHVVPPDVLQNNLQVLRTLLQNLSEEKRAEALTVIANGDDRRIARLLIHLAPYLYAGLATLAHQVTLRWVPAPRSDDLVIHFYHVLDSYGVPFEDSDWLFAQELIVEGLYIQAKSVLLDLVRQRPTPDRLWLLATAMWHRKDPIREQLEVLHQFIASTIPSDIRSGEAWKRIGEFCIENEDSGMAAIEACKNAEGYGLSMPQLHAFRMGNWDAIPALHHHPDYVFPSVVVLDLESDYVPEAAPGTRVFEIGAVRVKGSTKLDMYHAIIRRDFVSPKVPHRQEGAVRPEQAIQALQWFIGTAFVVGHNIQAFDVLHLRAMGLSISDDKIIDTLTFARLLYPDSLHHHLALLCSTHNISFEGEVHTALVDAQACADLLHALGDELVSRGERLLAGFRAFVGPESAFDRAVLQPRNVAAHPGYPWDLDPAPTTPHVLASIKDIPASTCILKALETKRDALIERYDPNAAYVQHLPAHQRAIVTVATRARLERILVAYQERSDFFVLPDPHTLLCPHRLRQHIEEAESYQMKLSLFCLYQASYNHDARTLYPLRILSGEPTLEQLKRVLIESCCESDRHHADSCSAVVEAKKAAETSCLLLATHESFLYQKYQPGGDVIIVDDVDELQMHFAEYLVERITSEQLRSWSAGSFTLLETYVQMHVKAYIDSPEFHERWPFHTFVPYLMQPQDGHEKSLLTLLKEVDPVGEAIAHKIESFYQSSLQKADYPGTVRAFWLDLHFTDQQQEDCLALERWSVCGLNRDLRKAFQELIWQPYKQHILCGTAITLGALKEIFLKRFFGLPNSIAFYADQRPPAHVCIPTSQLIRPSSFLGRRPWAEGAGVFLYKLAASRKESLVVTLHSPVIAKALTEAFKAHEGQLHRQVLSPHLGWTTAKIADRLAMNAHAAMAIISPYLRSAVLDGQVDVEVTGPLRFLNQHDPLVAAQMRTFAELYRDEGYFSAYLLPQALLELKARISSQANVHIILDSALRDAVYRDEVFSLFEASKLLETLAVVQQDTPGSFATKLASELERLGLSPRSSVTDQDLLLTLQAFWETDTFRESPLDQKKVVRDVLDEKDQLVVAATGGGKSLCFQLPAILLAQDVIPKVTLIFSPLIALMRDQVAALQHKGVFSAVVLDSTLSSIEREKYLQGIKRGNYSIIYIAPEQIHSSALRHALARREVGLIAIDEAHCVSQWGHNFRTDYFGLKKWIDTQICERRERSFPLLALTATARKSYIDSSKGYDEKGTIEDIIEKLGLRLTSDNVMLTSPERQELAFHVEHVAIRCPHCHEKLEMKIGEVMCRACFKWCSISKEDVRQAKLDTLLWLLSKPDEIGLRTRWEKPYGQRQRGIVYCRTIKETVNVGSYVRNALPDLRVDVYHGKLSREERERVYQCFMNDSEEGLDIVVATNAFGMGIDARRLGFVIHFDVPATLEAYYQEAGRAGRDPEFRTGRDRAQCILLYHEDDLESQRWLTSQDRITEEDIEAVYEALSKLRNPGEQEILVTERDIGLLSGVEKEKIATCLFYLEYHTRANGSLMLKRWENAVNLRQLKFEQGYYQRIIDPAMSTLSKQLVEVFCTSQEFGLSEERMTIIDVHALAADLKWEINALELEVKNLVKRNIIVFPSSTYVKWLKKRVDGCNAIGQVIKDTEEILNHLADGDAFQNGRTTYVDVQGLYDRGELSGAVSLQIFTHFLSLLAHTDADDLQLFASFAKETKATQQKYYRLRLESELQPNPHSRVQDILMNIQKQLCQTVELLGEDILTDKWDYLDLLIQAPNFRERQHLRRSLLWLNTLGLLRFPEEEKRDIVMRIHFEQDAISPDDLEIDLSSLRLIELYGEKKLALMREYAMLPQEQRRQLLQAYFFGERPLLEPFEMRTDLTEEQAALVKASDGYHLVKGPAGSGKTTVLLEHFRYLVEHLLVPIDRILVTAHFNSATVRMSSDLEDVQENRKSIAAKTLNSLGERIFRRHRQLLRWVDGRPYYAEKVEVKLLKGSWTEREEQELALVSCALERLHREKWMQGSLPADLRLFDLPETYKRDASRERRCREAISRFRSLGIFPGCISVAEDIRIILERTAKEDALFVANDLSFYYAVYLAYQLVQGEKRIYTYDDQILFALAILKANPEIAREYQRLYEHIIIDEFQDLTSAEADLVGILCHKHRNVLAVGDLRQRILFKQSEDICFDQAFELLSDDHLVQEHYLTKNFRSAQEILNFANALLARYSINTQVAARGSRGVKPCVIRVSSLTPYLVKTDEGIDDHLLYAMVDAALHLVESLSAADTGSVALMVARSRWSHRVQTYLKKVGRAFSVLDNTHQYQSYYVKLVLTYFRLIYDKNQDEEVERLLRRCVIPYFEATQIRKLKAIAEMRGLELLDVALDKENLKQVNATEQQEAALLKHVAVLQKHCADSIFEKVWQSISELPDGPIAQVADHEQETEELKAVLNELRDKSVKQALDCTDSHITFLERHRTNRDLVVTTIDYAKSQDFDTVFLLGADWLKDKRRWYVSVTRARQRFFCLIDAEPPEDRKNSDIFSSVPKEFYDELFWP